MKKLIGLAVGLLLLINCAFCDEIFSFGISSGFLTGKISEYVYDHTRVKSDLHLSELYWNLYAIPYSGFTFTARPNKIFFMSFNGIFSYPNKFGKLESYSYMNNYPDANGWIFPGANVAEYTSYSSHEVSLKHYYDLSGCVGGCFYLPFDFEISPYFKYEYSSLFIQGNDGYERSKRDDTNWRYTRYKGTVIDYKVVLQNMYLGCKTDISYLNPCVFYVSYELCPWFGFINAYDNHYVKKESFKDVLDNIVCMKWCFDVSYKSRGFQKFEGKLELTYLPETYGEFRMINNKDGGIKEFLADLSFIYNVYF